MADMTPLEWVAALEPKLNRQAELAKGYRDYYDGNQRISFATQKFKEAFAQFFAPMANNWMQIVVDAVVERLEVQGFRFGPREPGVNDWDLEADDAAAAIWQHNNLDAAAVMAHTEAVKCGRAFAMVQPAKPEPRITIEHPGQMYVACSAADRRVRLAALKRWLGEDGYAYLTLYLPGSVHKFRSAEKLRGGQAVGNINWSRRENTGEPNPLGVVPVVPLENDPDLLNGGRSDLDVAIPIQDAVNKLCLDMQVSSEFHAYPQRWAAGWEVPRVPKDPANPDGEKVVDPKAALRASQAFAWVSEDTDTKFGQLEPGDVKNYIEPIELYIDHLAAQTRTPAYYLKGKMANMSADALKAAETGLVYRARRKTLGFGEGWEETMRLAFHAKGDSRRAQASAAETMWADVESRSLAQLVDAAVKLRESLSLPLEMCWQMVGMSPQQIKQAKNIIGLPDKAQAASGNGGGNPQAVVLPAGVQG